MEFIKITHKTEFEQNKKVENKIAFLSALFSELEIKKIPLSYIEIINGGIEKINSFSGGTDKKYLKSLKKFQSNILTLIEKELGLVPKNYYRNMWPALGMSVFGVPLGVAFGASLNNMAYLGIGLPIGLVIGMAIGTQKDKKALAEGKQLDIEIEI